MALVDRRGADVAGEDEHERQRDRERRPDEVHGERQRALVDRRQAVGRGHRGEPERDGEGGERTRRPTDGRGTHCPGRAGHARLTREHAQGHRQAVRLRRRTMAPMTATRTSAATIGMRTSPPDDETGAGSADGDGAGVADGAGEELAVGRRGRLARFRRRAWLAGAWAR